MQGQVVWFKHDEWSYCPQAVALSCNLSSTGRAITHGPLSRLWQQKGMLHSQLLQVRTTLQSAGSSCEQHRRPKRWTRRQCLCPASESAPNLCPFPLAAIPWTLPAGEG